MRNRAQGWKHAKRSGHKNEDLVCQHLNNDEGFRQAIALEIGVERILRATVGGLHETSVESIGGGCTKSKTDLKIETSEQRTINVSIKKSSGGQVYLIGVDRFFLAVEHLGIPLPSSVKRGINLMFSNASDIEEIIRTHETTSAITDYQIRKNRLVWSTLELYDSSLAADTLAWFKKYSGDLAQICFGTGLASNQSDWAEFVWYINLLNENSMNTIISVDRIVELSNRFADELTFPGSMNGGSTIQMPFGFLQWHQSKLQLHHKYDKISEMINRVDERR